MNNISNKLWGVLLIIIGLVSLLCLNYFIFSDSIIAVFSAMFSLTYVLLAGKGNFYCYLFGLSGSGLYCWFIELFSPKYGLL